MAHKFDEVFFLVGVLSFDVEAFVLATLYQGNE